MGANRVLKVTAGGGSSGEVRIESASGKNVTLRPPTTLAADTTFELPVIHYYVNAKTDYNAVGDGVANDTTAIQNAIDALEVAGGALIFPPGDYLIDLSRLTYNSVNAIMFIGSGWASKLTWNPATDTPTQDKGMLNIHGTGDASASHCAGVIIKDLMFDFGGSRADAYDSNKRGINIYNSDNVIIESCYLKGAKGEMLNVGGFGTLATIGDRCTVKKTFFYDCAQYAASLNTFNTMVTDCNIKQASSGIIVSRDYVTIAGNDFFDIENTGVRVESSYYFVVENNRFKKCASVLGASLEASIYVHNSGSAANAGKHGNISGNVIDNSTTHTNQAGIAFARGGSSEDPSIIVANNNTIYGSYRGIYAKELGSSIINGNLITSSSSHTGIAIVNVTNNIDIRLIGNVLAGTWSNTAVEDLTTAQGNLQIGNVLLDDISLPVTNSENKNILDINKTGTGVGDCIKVINAGSGRGLYIDQNATAVAFLIEQAGNDKAIYINKTGTGAGHGISIDNAGVGRSLYISQTGAATAVDINQSQNNDGLTVTKTGAGAGSALSISNSGTGKDIVGSSSNWSMDKNGNAGFNGDIDAAGGYRHILSGWYYDNIPASLGDTNMALPSQSNVLMGMTRSGSITGLSATMSGNLTAGSITVKVYKNGAYVFSITISSPSQGGYTTNAKDTYGFSAGDTLKIMIATDASFAPSGSLDIDAQIEIET